MEFHHDISAFAGKAQAADPWLLATGDPTGFAMHADLVYHSHLLLGGMSLIKAGSMAGKMAQDAIAVDPNDPTKTRCFVSESGSGAAACFTLLSGDEMKHCSVRAVVNEEVSGSLAALTGCNPIQTGSSDATPQTNCPRRAPPNTAASATETSNQTTDTGDDRTGWSISMRVDLAHKETLLTPVQSPFPAVKHGSTKAAILILFLTVPFAL